MNRFSSVRDNTMLQAFGGSGMPLMRLWMCGHRSVNGVTRPMGAGLAPVMWKCAKCAEVKA